nr:IclR family transcriptional regulator [Castellaniella sp.]
MVPSRSAARGQTPVPGTESSLFVGSVEKAMRVLAAFDERHTHLSLSKIASLTGLDLSATQRFTHTLTTLGYLAKDPATKAYSPSVRLLDFAFRYAVSNEVIGRAAPYLRQLSQETEETTNITVLDGTDIVFALRIVSRHVLNSHVITGTRLPAYCTAPGLAILSQLPEPEARAILDDSELVAYTQNTVTRPERILERLRLFRQRGYAHTEDEYYMGDISTAAAIVDRQGRPVAAINVAVSRPRWQGADHERRIADLVIAAASAVSGHT